ncbi:MAG TPA: amidase [Candidatus Dormibacteraeota bacterium]|nr:amidase [Candidatus Dormibacteraeota bacterium]
MKLADALERIADQRHLNAFISFARDGRGEGEVVAVKDLIDVKGMVTTAGGTILPLNPAGADAPVIQRLRAAGCLFAGKTNLHEWAFGITSVNPHYGPVLNPVDPSRIAGGSSGGSAVAVAIKACDWAVGTDTGGSIRVPAALCGVVGLKPSAGAIPTAGVFPLAQSLDTVGPMASRVAGVARGLALMSGQPQVAITRGSPSQPRLAIPRAWVDDLDDPTADVWKTVARGLDHIQFPDRQLLSDCALTILFYEAAQVHKAWMEEFPHRYGADVLALLREAATVSLESYESALVERRRLAAEAQAALVGWDALIMPTTARVACMLTDQRRVREVYTRFTRPFNATGQPAISIPGAVAGLPVGIQLVGAIGEDRALLATAAYLEHAWSQ